MAGERKVTLESCRGKHHRHPDWRREVVVAASYRAGLPGQPDIAVPVFITALHDAETDVQSAAALALGCFGPGASAALPELRRLAEPRNHPGVVYPAMDEWHLSGVWRPAARGNPGSTHQFDPQDMTRYAIRKIDPQSVQPDWRAPWLLAPVNDAASRPPWQLAPL